MFSLLASLFRNRRILRDFVVRDLRARYVGSTMGFFWSVVFPIINLFVFMFVFRLVLNARWSDNQGALEVAIVMLAGIVVWTGFAETISRSTNTLVDNANLIQKVVFPAEVLPVYLTISSLINMCIGLPVVIGAVVVIGYLMPPQAYIHVPHEWQNDVRVESEVRIGEWDERTDPEDTRRHEYLVRVHLTRGWRTQVTIPFRLGGTAERGVDYELDANEITIPAGSLRGGVVLVPLADDEVEGDETVVFELVEGGDLPLLPVGAKKPAEGRRVHTLTIADSGPLQPEIALQPGDSGVHLPVTDPGEERYYPLQLGPALAVLPLLFLLQVVFTVGIGYFLSAFNLYLRDTFHVVGVGLTVWMFSTPIFYPAAMVERAGFGWMMEINPMHWLIDSYRAVLLHGIWPEPRRLVWMAGAALITFFLGGRFFMKHRRRFPDLL